MAVGTCQYRTTYGGHTAYAGSNSASVSVKVVSKASVLADLNAPRLTVTGIQSSAFAPGMKVATLALIGSSDVNVRAGSYGGATAELKIILLVLKFSSSRRPSAYTNVYTASGNGCL